MKNYNLLLFLLIGGFLLLSILSNNAFALPMRGRQEPVTGDATGGTWQVIGLTGVNAMHMFLAAPTKLVFIDKQQNNPLQQAPGQPAASAEYDLTTNTLRPLTVTSDTFCSAGSWLGNGIMLHTGGDNGNKQFAPGGQSIRFYDPAAGNWVEKVGLMPSKRWYPTLLTLTDGRVFILGGSTGGTGLNRADINNPTYNIWPPKNNAETPDPDIPFQFLTDTLPYNLYVFVHIVPNNENKNLLFVLSNQRSILFDLDSGTNLGEYPKIAVQRTYPQTGSSVMLPLRPEDNYKAVVMVCGGQEQYEITAPAAASCGRLDLSAKEPAWEMDNFGGIPRVMPDSVILVDGSVIFINGAQTGYAGFRKGSAANPLWANSNPAFNPVIYDPYSKQYAKMNPSTIARMYHSVAALLPDGSVAVAGSNPQGNVAKNVEFPTEYRIEIFKPPYILTNAPRPVIVDINGTVINQGRIPVNYAQTITITVQIQTTDTPVFKAAIIHHGFVTHSQTMSQRYVGLVINSVTADSTTANQYLLSVTLPPNPTIIAPGPSYIYILNNNNTPCESGAEVLLN